MKTKFKSVTWGGKLIEVVQSVKRIQLTMSMNKAFIILITETPVCFSDSQH